MAIVTGSPALFLPAQNGVPDRRNAILVDDSHGTSDIANEYNFGSAELGRVLSTQGRKVEGTTHQKGFRRETGLTRGILDQFGILIVNGLCGNRDVPFTEMEVGTIKQWVQDGGSLLVVSAGPNFGKVKTSSIMNPVIEPFGLEFRDGHLDQTQRTTKLKAGHPIARGLREFSIIHGTPVVAHGVAEDVAWVGEDSVLAVTDFGRGRVAAFGGGSALMGQALNSKIIKHSAPAVVTTNKALLANLIRWLAGDGRAAAKP